MAWKRRREDGGRREWKGVAVALVVAEYDGHGDNADEHGAGSRG